MSVHFTIPDTYAAWTKDAETRYKSTSGGAFSELAKTIIDQGGVVAGARYNDECLVEHCIIDKADDIGIIRQSKYMSSRPLNIYQDVKKYLSAGTKVGYCGSPCQVAGLYAFLEKDYDNLFTFDFICRGMNSPKAFKAWLSEEETKAGSKVSRVWFKYKEGGWKSSPKRTRIDFKNGNFVVKEGDANLFMHGYLSSNLYMRPSCGNCRFKGTPRHGDITLADFWGIEKELDDDKGTSLLLINSEKGRILFDNTKDKLLYYQRDFEEITKGNPMFDQSASVPNDTHRFLADLDDMSFSEALRKYNSYPKHRSILSRIKYRIFKAIKGDVL